jgi:uncharacterized membrane-anchored protein YitT (DUF2179 family)
MCKGILVGATLVALSVQFLNAGGLFTGQIAGLAIIGTLATGWSFGALFFAMNLPFYALAVLKLGWRFTIKSLIAVSLMSALADAFAVLLHARGTAALAGAGAVRRAGRTGSSCALPAWRELGGVGIVALWLQDRNGFPAGARSSSSTSASFPWRCFCSIGKRWPGRFWGRRS